SRLPAPRPGPAETDNEGAEARGNPGGSPRRRIGALERTPGVTQPRPTCAAAAHNGRRSTRADASRHGPRGARAGLASAMAPARIELAHADSKSAALSTELRGLGLRVDEVRRRFPSSGSEQVVDEDACHRL